MTAVRSSLLVGQVSHSRLSSPAHAFAYRLFMLRLDLDEIADLDGRLWMFGTRRLAPVRFDAADFMGVPGRGASAAARLAQLRARLDDLLRDSGVTSPMARIEVLAHARIAGYVFNPVSFFLCYDAPDAERPAAIVADVHNTFGERHAYVVPASAGTDVPWLEKKVFHVSPFFTLDGTYRFDLDFSRRVVDARIDLLRDGRPIFMSRLQFTPRPLTDAALATAVLRFPLMTARVIGAIHWEALRLWRKGVAYHPKPDYDPARARATTRS